MSSTPEACSAVAFPPIGSQLDCATVTQKPQTYRGNNGPEVWLLKQHKGGLKGPMLVGSDTRDSNRASTAVVLVAQSSGIKGDVVPISAAATQKPPSTSVTARRTTLVEYMSAWMIEVHGLVVRNLDGSAREAAGAH